MDDERPSDDDLLALYEAAAEQQEADGVSVDVDERRRVMGKIAAIYARNARADGMTTALEHARHRDDLERRYFNPNEVAADAQSKARGALRDIPEIAKPLLKSDELIAAGFAPTDVREEAEMVLMSIQLALGVRKKAKGRNATLRALYDPTARQKEKA
jgi:hypothetical protein